MNLTFKRHCPLIGLLALITIALILGVGDQRIIAYTVPANAQMMEQSVYIAQAEISGLLHILGIQ